MPSVDTKTLGAMEVRDSDGNPVRVGSAWETTAALLVFLRHFG